LAEVLLLCQKSGEWKYIKGEARWLADDNEAADAFQEDIWQIALPERLWGPAKKHFGLKSVSASVRTKCRVGEVCGNNEGLQATLKQTLPYVFVWRLSKSKQDARKLRDALRHLSVCMVSELKATLTIEGVGSRVVEKQHTVDGHRLLVIAGEGSRQSNMAEALATFLKAKSDAEFFENLFRCKNDDERKLKLLSKDVPHEEIDRFLREFREEVTEIQQSDEQGEQEVSTKPTEQSTMHASGGSSEQTHEPSKTPANKEESGLSHVETAGPILRLKNPQSADIEFASSTPAPTSGRSSGAGGRREINIDREQLSQEQKWEIEQCARDCAKQILKDDWKVKVMPPNHPGFDLKATKGSAELLIEVKGHRTTSSVADLTVRQLNEYYKYRESKKWQLWNVENLAEDAGPVRISPYVFIPDEALRGKQFSVDLHKCEMIPPEELL